MTSNNNTYKSNLIYQQIIAIDVCFNTFRNNNFKSLYIKRRNQLIRDKTKTEVNCFRKQYLKLRVQYLNQRYGVCFDHLNRNMRSNRSNSSKCTDDSSECNDRYLCTRHESLDPHLPLKYESDLALNIESNHLILNPFSQNYSFSGMYHIFDQHVNAVTSIKFANNDKSLLACSSMDCTLSVCQLTPSPATVLYVLKGHTSGVNWFEWSLSNDLIVSCSLDSTVKLWDAASGSCLRTIEDPYGSAVLTCTFQPNNNNMIITGNAKGYIQILNVSTGIYTNCGLFNNGGYILCMCFDSTGKILWVGDSKGFISSYIFEMKNCQLILANKVIVVAGCAITSLSFCLCNNYENNEPLLLVNSACNALLLFKVRRKDVNLEIKHSFSIKHQNRDLVIRSSFCPIISNRDGICVVTGSEDTCVYFFNANDKYSKNKCVNKLHGHSAPVLDVCFNYDESLLASSDSKGNVIIWKRETL